MDARDATANNADLWAQFFRQQWRLFLDPFGLASPQLTDTAASTLADAAAASVSGALTALIAPPIGQMCHEATVEVDAALDAADDVEIPADFAVAHPKPRGADLTQREEWLVSSAARHAVEAY